ncbi:MAG: hypothetical protein N2C14_06865, partial [Planctomycetales bacterium]
MHSRLFQQFRGFVAGTCVAVSLSASAQELIPARPGGYLELEEAEDVSASPYSEIIQERYSNGRVKVKRRVTQDSEGNYLNHG